MDEIRVASLDGRVWAEARVDPEMRALVLRFRVGDRSFATAIPDIEIARYPVEAVAMGFAKADHEMKMRPSRR